MTLLTKQEIEALLDGTTPGPWRWSKEEYDEGRSWHLAPGVLILDEDGGGPDGADEIDAANSGLIAAAPTIARTALDALARLEDAEARLAAAEAQVAALTEALHDAINAPKGVVPQSADRFYNPRHAALATVTPPADTTEGA